MFNSAVEHVVCHDKQNEPKGVNENKLSTNLEIQQSSAV